MAKKKKTSNRRTSEKSIDVPAPSKQQTLTRGRFTYQEDDYIKKNYTLLTDKQLGAALNRSPKSIENRRKKLGLNNKKEVQLDTKKEFRSQYLQSLPEDDREKLLRKELRSTATYKAIKGVLDKRELDFYEEKYIAFLMDPTIETMTYPEKDALHEMTMCQIQLMRFYEKEKMCINQNQPFKHYSDIKNLQETIQKYQRDLNVTRERRLKDTNDTAINFQNLIKEMKQPELRRELGYEAAIFKYIAEKDFNNRIGENILTGNNIRYDVDVLFKEGVEPSGLSGSFVDL